MNEKTENVTSRTADCPDPEVISAFYDGELDSGSAEYKHIEQCPGCQAVLKSYDAINTGLKEGFAAPDDLADRISKLVNKRIANEKLYRKKTINFPLILKVAAMFFIVVGLGVFALNLIRDAKVKQIDDMQHELELGNPANYNPGGSIRQEDLQPISFGPDGSPKTKLSAEKTTPVDIADNVKQVWVVKNIVGAKGKIDKIVKFLKISDPAYTRGKTSNSVQLKAKLSKLQLVNFVRLCERSGFELLTPDAPQPEQTHFNGKGSEKVRYIADFVTDRN